MKFFKQNHENKIINKNDLSTTLKSFAIIVLSILFVGCSSDDDSNSSSEETTQDFLTSGKWYQESRTPGNFTDCEKNSSFKFNTDNTLNVESFGDDSGTCESQEMLSATYTLSGMSLTITINSEVITATINSISESSMNVTDSEGETIVFDRTQG